MNDQHRLQLQKMLVGNKDAIDQTGLIRQLKHSHILRSNIESLVELKQKYVDDPVTLETESIADCAFLHTYYTDIFNKVKNDEIDMNMLHTFLDVLEKIENGDADQHEGSFEIGTLLKEIYIDSAVRKSEKIDKAHENSVVDKIELRPAVRRISYLDYARMVSAQSTSDTTTDPSGSNNVVETKRKIHHKKRVRCKSGQKQTKR